MLRSIITDMSDGFSAEIDHPYGESQGLVVATRPLKTFSTDIKFFSNADFGIDMHQNASSTGTPEVVYAEDAEWTTSAIGGVWDFASTDQAFAGSKSVDATLTINNNTAEFNNGSDLDTSTYANLSGHVYITSWPLAGTKEANIYGWDVGLSSIVGTAVDIGDYVNTNNLNVWQKFTIPLVDMALSNAILDAVRINMVALGAGGPIDCYFDNIEFESALPGEGTLIYNMEPDLGTWAHLLGIKIVLADALDTTLADASMPNLSYDKLLGEDTLLGGILFQRVQNDQVQSAVSVSNISGWLDFPLSRIEDLICDSTNTYLTIWIPYAHPEILKAELNDELRIMIVDDLTGLLRLRMSVSMMVEQRPLPSSLR